MSDEKKWFLPGPGEENLGPMRFEDVLARWKDAQINTQTECWHEGMDEWRPLGEVEEFAAAMEQHRRAVRSQWVRRGGIVTIVVLLLGVVAGIYLAVRGPVEIQQAERLLESGLYADAGRVLGAYVYAHPDNIRAAYLLGFAALGDYACGEAAPSSGDPLTHAQVDAARTHLARTARQDPALTIRLAADLDTLAGQISPSAALPCARLYAVNSLRAELAGASPPELVGGLVELAARARELGNEAGLSQQITPRVLKWDPASAGAVFAVAVPRDLRAGYAWTTFLEPYLEACRDQAKAREPLGLALLDYADTRAGGGDPALADQIIRASVEICPALAGQAEERKLRQIVAEIAAGNAAEALRKLDRLSSDAPDTKTRIAQLYFDAGTALGEKDPKSAERAVGRAFALDPTLLASEERLLAAIRSLPHAGVGRLDRIRLFLNAFPDSAHAPELRIAMVRDASVQAQDRNFWRLAQAPLIVESARAEAMRSLGEIPPPVGTEGAVLDLVMNLGSSISRSRDKALREQGLAQVIALADRFLGAYPDTPRRAELELAKDTWRKLEGHGTLPGDLDSLMDHVDEDLRILVLSSPGAVNVLNRSPDAYHVVQVPSNCGKDRFSSAQAATLRQWVNNGGVLWASGDVLDLFGIGYQAGHGRAEVSTANPGVSEINTGCSEVVLNVQYREAVNLDAAGVIPLMANTRGVATWSLVPYGRGWISDVKNVDVARYDGARFWLNYRLFCMGETIPGASADPGAVHRPAPGTAIPPAGVLPPAAEPIALSDEEQAVVDICTQLARRPNDVAQLRNLKAGIAASDDLEHRDRYLAIYCLGSLHARQATNAQQAFEEMTRSHPGSAYAAMISPESFMTACPECHGSTRSETTCTACRGNIGNRCAQCGGSGRLGKRFRSGSTVCPHCSGTGRTVCATCRSTGTLSRTCIHCKGKGQMYSEATVRVRYLELLQEATRSSG